MPDFASYPIESMSLAGGWLLKRTGEQRKARKKEKKRRRVLKVPDPSTRAKIVGASSAARVED